MMDVTIGRETRRPYPFASQLVPQSRITDKGKEDVNATLGALFPLQAMNQARSAPHAVRAFRRTLFSTIAILAVAVHATASEAQGKATGLAEAPREYLARIPDAFSPFAGDSLPARVDLTSFLPPPGDQGQQGSCVAWTVAYALRSYQASLRAKTPPAVGGSLDSSLVFSPAFVYNQLNNGRNAGIYFGDALNLMQDVGAVPLRAMPYDFRDYVSQPDSEALADAPTHRILSWRKVDHKDLIEIKSQLNAGYPVMIGARIDDAFMVAGKNYVWRDSSGTQRGAHAMLVVGYDDDRHALRLQNSWGERWGDGGYAWVDYDYFPRVVREAYVAKDRYVPPPPPKKIVMKLGPAPRVIASMPSAPDPVRGTIVPTIAKRSAPAITRPVIVHLRPPAEAFLGARVSIVRVRQDVTDSLLGRGIRFDGLVSVPPGAAGDLQVVVQLYGDSAGRRGTYVRSTSPRFRVGRDRAATGTSPFALGPSGAVSHAWRAFLPYSALDLPQEAGNVSHLIAEPVLYVDRFGVLAGKASPIACVCAR